MPATTSPQRHHLDRFAADLVVIGDGSLDDLLTTVAVADWLHISTAWLEIGRTKGYGPAFVRLSTRRIRYRRADVLRWLEGRIHRCTADYGPTEAA